MKNSKLSLPGRAFGNMEKASGLKYEHLELTALGDFIPGYFALRWLKRVLRQVPVIFFLLTLPCALQAETASGTAFGEQASLNLSVLGLGADAASSGPAPAVSRSGMDSFGPQSESTAGVNLELLGGVAGVSTGVLRGTVMYDNGLPEMRASGEVVNVDVDLDVLGLVGLTLNADEISSTSTVSNACGGLQPSGQSSLTNAVLNVLGASVNLASNPAPNTQVNVSALGLAGVTVILNEQRLSGNSLTGYQMTTNAVRIILDVDLSGAALSGEIIFGHSEATVQCNHSDLQISKTAAPEPVTLGSQLIYTISVFNAGPQTATAVEVADSLPASVVVDEIIPSGAGTCNYVGFTVTCQWPSLAMGASEQVQIVTTPQETGTIANTAVVDTDDYDPGPDSVTITTVVDPQPSANADISVSKTANPDPVTVGEPLTYTVVVRNHSADVATDVTIQDNLPANVMLRQVSPSGVGVCSSDYPVVICTWPTLNPNATEQVEIRVIPQAAGDIQNNAVVDTTANDPDPTNNTVTITTTVDPAPGLLADLTVNIRVLPEPGRLGRLLYHRLTVDNLGPAGATDVVLEFTLPNTLDVVNIDADDLACGQQGNLVVCTRAALAVGATGRVLVESIPLELGEVAVSALVEGAETDPQPDNNIAQATTDIIDPEPEGADLAITGTLNPNPAAVGEPVVHAFTIVNYGPQTADNALLNIQLPPHLVLLGVEPGLGAACSDRPGTVICELGTLMPGDAVQVFVEGFCNEPAEVIIEAHASADPFDPRPDNNAERLNGVVLTAEDVRGMVGQPVAVPVMSPVGLLVLLGLVLAAAWYGVKRQGEA